MKLKKLTAAVLLTIIGASGVAGAWAVEPETAVKEAAPEIKHDAKAIEVIENALDKAGGRELIEVAESVHTTGTVDIPMAGLKGTMEVFAATGGNLLIKVNIPGFGEQLTGLHDGIGWSIDPMGGPKLMEGAQLDALVEQSDPQNALKYKEHYSIITYVGESEFNGQKVHQIEYVNKKSGQTSTEYYAINSGLLAGSVATTDSEMGEITVTTTVNEYKDFGGVQMPSKTTQQMGPMSMGMTTSSAEFNSVDKSVFELPASIKALVEASKED
ncbi:MAG: hypothetical protein KC996_01660 [Phycisphaerales bacterium]|nr:hypothetical protein [Phycisphaerales bacterium]